jgi:hypothetical protein
LPDVWYSTDGANWTQATDEADFGTFIIHPSYRQSHSCVEHDSKMCLVHVASSSDFGCFAWYSSDGITWTRTTEDAIDGFSVYTQPNTLRWYTEYRYPCAAIGSVLYVPVALTQGFGGVSKVYSSEDAETWTIYPSSPLESADFTNRCNHSLLYHDGNLRLSRGIYETETGFVYNQYPRNDMWYSGDGESWTETAEQVNLGHRLLHQSVSFGGYQWIIGGVKVEYPSGVKTAYSDAWYSSDGVTWLNAMT